MMKLGLIFEEFFIGFILLEINNLILDIKEKVDLLGEHFLEEDLIFEFIQTSLIAMLK